MKTWLRKLRGILGIGAVWGLTGSSLALFGWAIASVFRIDTAAHAAIAILWNGFEFFALGSGFAVILTIMDGRKTFEELTPGRAAIWGSLAGATLLPIVAGLMVIGLGLGSEYLTAEVIAGGVLFGGAMTAGLAAGTVSLAKRDPERLGTSAVLDERKLLGGAHQFGPVWRKQQSSASAQWVKERVGP